MRRGAKLIDLTGKRFGKLTVLARQGSIRNGSGTAPVWLAACACGNEALIPGPNLRAGVTTSCGCKTLKHGMFGTPEYSAWTSMKIRCLNPSARNFKNYGGRGITVCPEWSGVDGFPQFLKDVGHRPSSKHSLDRINNNGNYEPGNVRWATAHQQGGNKRNCHVLSVRGQSAHLSEWARQSGIGKSTLRERLRRGWDPERAIFTPP